MKKCLICSKEVPLYRGHHKNEKLNKERRTCSKSCAIKLAYPEGRWHLPNPANSYGPTNTNWKGGIKMQHGYKMVRAAQGYQGKTTRGYIMEHRLVMEMKLNRFLEPTEAVHHRNGIKTDNRPENLELVVGTVHLGEVTCPHCRKKFLIQ